MASLPRLNRTFMELKLHIFVCAIGVDESQSYLYGIEIKFRQLGRILWRVSIVPLWNWNIIVEVALQLLNLSQSYLYGIEIRKKNLSFFTTSVSIVPLWNWNTYSGSNVAWAGGLNRTFMELKYNRRTLTAGAPSRLNRTFMELK